MFQVWTKIDHIDSIKKYNVQTNQTFFLINNRYISPKSDIWKSFFNVTAFN